MSPQSSPAQNTQSKITVARPNCTTEVRIIKQEMVLACIEIYVEVTQTQFQPITTCPEKILNCNAQCSPQQWHRQTDGNAPSPMQLKVHQVIGQIIHQGSRTTSPRYIWNKRYRHHCLHQLWWHTAWQDANGASGVYADETGKLATRVCWLVWPHQVSRGQWKCVHQGPKRDVQPTASRHPGT